MNQAEVSFLEGTWLPLLILGCNLYLTASYGIKLYLIPFCHVKTPGERSRRRDFVPCDHQYLNFKGAKLGKSRGAAVDVPYFLSKYDPGPLLTAAAPWGCGRGANCHQAKVCRSPRHSSRSWTRVW
jgi:hypothetical protein